MAIKNKSRNYIKNISVIIPAAGSGKRMQNPPQSPFYKGGNRGIRFPSKAFIRLNGKPLLIHSLDKFILLPGITEIIIAVNQKNWHQAERIISEYPFGFSSRDPSGSRDKTKLLSKRILPEIKLVKGGKERCDSVSNALKMTNPNSRIILIHDAARPLVRKEDIIRLIKAVHKNGAAILAVPVVDTIKRVSQNRRIKETMPRQELWAAQTPQGFKKNILMKAYATSRLHRDTCNKSSRRIKIITDDASLVENIGYPVKIISGSYTNIKITTPADKIFAQELLNFTKV